MYGAPFETEYYDRLNERDWRWDDVWCNRRTTRVRLRSTNQEHTNTLEKDNLQTVAEKLTFATLQTKLPQAHAAARVC